MTKLDHTWRPKRMHGYDQMHAVNGLGLGLRLNSHALLVIKLPDSRVLRMMSLSLLLAMAVLALPSVSSTKRASSGGVSRHDSGPEAAKGFRDLPVLLRNLMEEGLVKKGHKGFILGTGEIGTDLGFLRDAGVDLLAGADLQQQQQNAVVRQVFDFVFAQNFYSVPLIDGMLRDRGLVIAPLGHDPSDGLRFLSSYKIVYLRRFESTVVAMRKPVTGHQKYSKKAFSGVTPEARKAALKGLEDVDLEPPAEKPSFTSTKIKFLPDLLEDTLNEYPRRVFISDDSGALEWLYQYYPTRDQEFEAYKMDNDGQLGVANWLATVVRREDYVVMKAEAQAVEEMLKEKSLYLVDELFLECKNQWEDGEEEHKSKRAYWQCLALYGKVRDEGIAVHQWWN